MKLLISIVFIFLCGPRLLRAESSEYQLEAEPLSRCEALRGVSANQGTDIPQCTEDGRFRPVQCSGRSQQCWCVDAEGQEVKGTRTNNSVIPHCASPCQLQAELTCSPAGLFQSVQCDSSRGQCWCVDQDGMELYGTRQAGKPSTCPGPCEVRSRRLLHGSGSASPPQCAADGSFLPVQCTFINMTDRSQVDLLHAFNRFPEAFQTFQGFQRIFPQVSSYCFCTDSRGRELANTGVELFLSDVYDSAFSVGAFPHSVAQTNVYRVLKRRMLGVRLAATGHFRCPSPCEVEREAAMEVSSLFVPSCESDGAFSSTQCQQGGQCWCVDAKGAELPGTRRHGDAPVCSVGSSDCRSQRRLALSRLFSGPVDPPSSSGTAPPPCQSLLQSLGDILLPGQDSTTFLFHLVEVFVGLFPSVGGALQALSHSSPRRLQENLFGGKFLKNTATFNLSSAVGTRGVFVLDRLSPENLNLLQSVIHALEAPPLLSALQQVLMRHRESDSAPLHQVLGAVLRSCSDTRITFVPRCTPTGTFQLLQCDSGHCWCVDPQGREVAGSKVAGRRPRCPTRCERERAAALELRSTLAAGAEIHVPSCSEDGDFLSLQCVGSRCFCVDEEGKAALGGASRGAVTCPSRSKSESQPSSGCAAAQSQVEAFRRDALQVAALSNSSSLSLSYGFLLAEGIQLTPEELGISQSQEELQVSDWLLSRSDAALRLAAFSTVQMLQSDRRGSYQLFTPQCDANGQWMLTQCYHSTGQCWCVTEDGEYVPDSLTDRSLHLPTCQTRCQRAQHRWLLSGWLKASDMAINSAPSYQPKCEQDGSFSVLQTGGDTGLCVNPLTGQTLQTATENSSGQLTCPSRCELQALQCAADGSFKALQCDGASCWCVSEDGQEIGGTRTPQGTGRTPSCDRPVCPMPSITHGALLCQPIVNGRQSCELVCSRGYQNSLPAHSFQCDAERRQWDGANKPVGGACQRSGPLHFVSSSQLWSFSSSCLKLSSLQKLLLSLMTSRGLCSAQLPVSSRSVSMCDDSALAMSCDNDAVMLTVTWTFTLSDLPTSDLPHLHDVVQFLNESRLLGGLEGILGSIQSMLTSEPKLVSMTTPTFGCSHGYHLDSEGEGCVICPAGSFFSDGACLLCPEGTYQDVTGRNFCKKCPKGSSPAGASSANQCETQCEGRGPQMWHRGDWSPPQPGSAPGRWRCVSSEGAELQWTESNAALTGEDCSVLRRFQQVLISDLIFGGEEDTDVLQTMTSDLPGCARACAVDSSCHHVALSNNQTTCELYSTHTMNTHCNASQQTRGFLGNPEAELYDSLSCSLKVRGGATDMLVIRKKDAEFPQRGFVRMRMAKAVSGVFRTQVFASRRTSLTDAQIFCQVGCERDACCDGYILNHNSLNGGSLLCGWLRAPSVLVCGDQDWDVLGQGSANRICGAGLTYNQQQRSFLFDFGGQKFTITDAALPADSKNKKDYQSSIISFQSVFLNSASADSGSSSCPAGDQPPPPRLNATLQMNFDPLSEEDVLVNPQKKLPSLSHLLHKNTYDSQQALLWCLQRCDSEPLCSLADLRDSDSLDFFSCSLFPDTRVCGSYDTPLRRPCRPLLDRAPNNTYRKTMDLSGPVKSFYERVSFQKMVSYSVRSRVTLKENTPLSEGFRECERRCDEDPCCRGIGFVRDTKSEGPGVVCLALISLGIQTCSVDDETTWKTQNCEPSEIKSSPEPFGFYQKPVNQWSLFPALCPSFTLPPTKTNVSLDEWNILSESSLLVDSSLSTYDVIHVSREIATDQDQTRNWCLHACQEAESCVAVSLRKAESATRCVLYPDTTICGLSSAHFSSSPASSCRLVLKEPASQVYLRTERLPLVTSVSIPEHGILSGVALETDLGSDSKTVVQFLGVPYARPPIGALRFEEAQPADWTGTWDATRPRASCVQPGDAESEASSEDCLYLNIFRPAAVRGRVPVLVFFFNPSANQNPALLDGSLLSALGDIVVVTASYRTAALGFLSTGRLHGNYGLSDQKAVLAWVHAHIALVGGDNSRVTVGAERRGADIASLHLLSSSSSAPLFHRMVLMGGSAFSPSLFQSSNSSRQQAMDLGRELGCVTFDPTDDDLMVSCLRAAPIQQLNAAQTKLMAVSGPFRSFSPVRPSVSPSLAFPVDLLLGSSALDGLIGRARRIKDFEALQGRADGKTAFYEALSRSLGGASGSELLKEAATWFYSLDHSPTAAGYNLFSRALDNATRDLFIICPSLTMASHWANGGSNVFLYHQPESDSSRADVFVPLDVQLVFGMPHRPISSQRFSSSERRLSLAMMTYVSSFVRSGNPNPSRAWAESALPHWEPVGSSETPPTYLTLSPALSLNKGLRQNACSFWTQLGTKLTNNTAGQSGAELDQLVLNQEIPLAAASSAQSQTDKDAYN
ncbi:thyroglobulin [Gouania willdenowi]|uniref:thyroglobulin n=1 Tax=Gouania willdenowi TaxID=441366 RepID=UPI001056D51F|nr:thyroglobulin [Gouania willdenowi]